MGKMTINGVSYDVPPGASVSVVDGVVKINGQEVATYQQPVSLTVTITGAVNVVHAAGSVSVTGDVGAYVKADGSVDVRGAVKGSVAAGGSVRCGDVTGDVRAGGSAHCGMVSGGVTAGGSVRHG